MPEHRAMLESASFVLDRPIWRILGDALEFYFSHKDGMPEKPAIQRAAKARLKRRDDEGD